MKICSRLWENVMRIYNLGSLNIDYVYDVDHFVSAGETLSSDKMQIFPGGKGLNQSVALARAGAEVIHGAVIGEDGGFLTEILSSAGVDTSRIETISRRCGHAVIQVDKSGQNCILLYPGTNSCIDRRYIENFLSDAERDDILVVQNEISGLDIAFETASRKNMRIAFNPSPFHSDIKKLPLSLVRWLFCNETEGEALFGSRDIREITERFITQIPDGDLILTLGKDGSVFKNRKKFIAQPIFETKTVDTTAAGDTFLGYFLASVTKGESVERSMEIASKAASVAVSVKGASSSIPFLRDVTV